MRHLAVLMLLLEGCAGAAVGNAIVNSAVAAGVAAGRRANGDCYTPCNPGHVCNRATGTCEPLPCGGNCPALTHCEVWGAKQTCVADAPNTPLPTKPPPANLIPH